MLANAFPFCFVLAERQIKNLLKRRRKIKMKTVTKQSERYGSIEEYEENCYLFSPSISKRRSVGGRAYYVRRYFKGGQDFEKTMERLAVKQSYMKDAG